MGKDKEENSSNVRPETSDLAVIALVTSILLPAVGWFLGFRARKQIEESNGQKLGRPLATAAIWVGGIITVGWIALFGLMAVGMSFNNDEGGRGMGFGNHRMFNGGNDGPGNFGHGQEERGWFGGQGGPNGQGSGPGMMQINPSPNATPPTN
jgi:hypothetical protein